MTFSHERFNNKLESKEKEKMIYDFIVKDNKGNDVKLEQFKGKVLLIVNTATGCGFTPQYEGLENLYQKYKEQGFEILDFPCNQFFGQAKGNDEEIHEFCTLRYHTTFPRFKKICVNKLSGSDKKQGFSEIEPLYVFLKEQAGIKKITWNFNKFLVSKDGLTIKYFGTRETPESLEEDIKNML